MLKRILFFFFGWIIAKPAAAKIIEEKKAEAQRLYVEHQLAADHHQAIANMYRERYLDKKLDLTRPAPAPRREVKRPKRSAKKAVKTLTRVA